MKTRTFDPAAGGQCFQGDIAIVPMPKNIKIATTDEIKPVEGRLIIQEGEVTGHHHKIVLPRAIAGHNFAPARQVGDPTLTTRSPKLKKVFGGARKAEVTIGSEVVDLNSGQLDDFGEPLGIFKPITKMMEINGIARMYRDPAAVAALQDAGVITRTDLAIGCLVVEGGSVTVTHEEHDGITLPPGNYYCGRQVESAGAEERVVAD